MSTEHWYDMADLPLCELRDIALIWGTHQIERAHLMRRKGKLCWCRLVQDDDEAAPRVQWLPPRKIDPWPKEPSCWRPLHAGWRWPGGRVPEPLPVHCVPRMWNAMQSFGAVDDAEAAELAGEMQADRETARAQGERSDGGRSGSGRRLWWLDATKVAHAAPGNIFPHDAEGRLMRALASDLGGWCQDGVLGLRKQFDMDKEAAARLAEAEARRPPDFRPPFRALPADVQDFETAMGWYAALGDLQTRHVLWLASRDTALSWRDIGFVAGLKGSESAKGRMARMLYVTGLDEIVRVANGERTPGVVARAAKLEAVREGNRRARMGAA